MFKHFCFKTIFHWKLNDTNLLMPKIILNGYQKCKWCLLCHNSILYINRFNVLRWLILNGKLESIRSRQVEMLNVSCCWLVEVCFIFGHILNEQNKNLSIVWKGGIYGYNSFIPIRKFNKNKFLEIKQEQQIFTYFCFQIEGESLIQYPKSRYNVTCNT